MSIENLYKHQYVISEEKEWFALEKVHGTSARVSWNSRTKTLAFHPGGSESKQFNSCFAANLATRFEQQFANDNVEVFGEAYGGKILKMSKTYGPVLRFIVFEIQINGMWLNVPNADRVATNLGLEFVPYVKIVSSIESLNAARDTPSQVAIRRGLGNDKLREGIVIRPLSERVDPKHHKRVLYKHKRIEFSEHKAYRHLGNNLIQQQSTMRDQACDWVTPMRLTHVLDHLTQLQLPFSFENIASAMIADIRKESQNELSFDHNDKLIKHLKTETRKLCGLDKVLFSKLINFNTSNKAKICQSSSTVDWHAMPHAAKAIANLI